MQICKNLVTTKGSEAIQKLKTIYWNWLSRCLSPMSFFFIGCNIFCTWGRGEAGTFVQDAGLYHPIAAKKSLAFKNISNGPMIALKIHNKNFISMQHKLLRYF